MGTPVRTLATTTAINETGAPVAVEPVRSVSVDFETNEAGQRVAVESVTETAGLIAAFDGRVVPVKPVRVVVSAVVPSETGAPIYARGVKFGGGSPPAFVPSFAFNDARNSFYL